MPLRVTFANDGNRILLDTPVSLHWGHLGETYGVRLRETNDYRNGFVPETRLRITALRSKGQAVGYLIAGRYHKAGPRSFPTELGYEFLFAESARVKIEGDVLSGFIDIVKDLPWSLSKNGGNLKLDFVEDDYKHGLGSSLGLRLHLSIVFREPQLSQRPVEFEWGVPRVYSSRFESNRRRH